MRVLKTPLLNKLYFCYRMILPVLDPVKLYSGLRGYWWFISDIILFKRLAPQERIFTLNMYPILNEKENHPFDAHYFHQELWAYRRIQRFNPKKHVDIGSKLQFAGFIAAQRKADYVDVRSLTLRLPNLNIVHGSILSLPYKDNSIESLSTLHVIEHIGLGRYGDPIDPEGTAKACLELTRVLRKNGKLYVSIPTGKYRVCFNAHRVIPPQKLISYFNGLKLIEFSVIDDGGILHENENYKNWENLNYGCGLFLFTKL